MDLAGLRDRCDSRRFFKKWQKMAPGLSRRAWEVVRRGAADSETVVPNPEEL